MAQYTIEQVPFVHFLLADKRSAWLWLIIRLYLGWQWVTAGWEKLQDPTWAGTHAGSALTGFLQGALAKTAAATGSAHPDVQNWYAWFITHAVLPHTLVWSNCVACGEFLVGIALILGFLTGISVFFAMFMNLNYMLAGTVSVNPIWFVIGLSILLAWRVSGYIGLDRWTLPYVQKLMRVESRSAPTPNS